jgi:large subunit ribosomal protein L20
MRVKRGKVKHSKHKELLARAKGYRMSYNSLYRRAREALLHAGQYSFAHRRRRHSQMRNSWIKIIAAGLYGTGLSYSTFTGALKKHNIELDRKVLAEIAQVNPQHFNTLIKQIQA